MKQILQDLKSWKFELAAVPCPSPGRGHILIRARASQISTGMERILVDFGKTSYLQKAKQQPEKVRHRWAYFIAAWRRNVNTVEERS